MVALAWRRKKIEWLLEQAQYGPMGSYFHSADRTKKKRDLDTVSWKKSILFSGLGCKNFAELQSKSFKGGVSRGLSTIPSLPTKLFYYNFKLLDFFAC